MGEIDGKDGDFVLSSLARAPDGGLRVGIYRLAFAELSEGK